MRSRRNATRPTDRDLEEEGRGLGYVRKNVTRDFLGNTTEKKQTTEGVKVGGIPTKTTTTTTNNRGLGHEKNKTQKNESTHLNISNIDKHQKISRQHQNETHNKNESQKNHSTHGQNESHQNNSTHGQNESHKNNSTHGQNESHKNEYHESPKNETGKHESPKNESGKNQKESGKKETTVRPKPKGRNLAK